METKGWCRREIAKAIAIQTGADERTILRWIDGYIVPRVYSYAFKMSADSLGVMEKVIHYGLKAREDWLAEQGEADPNSKA